MRHTGISSAVPTSVATVLTALPPAIPSLRFYPSWHEYLYLCRYGYSYRYPYELNNHSRAGIRVLLSSLFSAVTGVTVRVMSLPLSKKYTSDRVFTLCRVTSKSCSHKKSSSYNFEKINIPRINQRDSGLISESVLIVLLSCLFVIFSSRLHLQSLVRPLSV